MTSFADAVKAVREFKGLFQSSTPSWQAYLGDGNGTIQGNSPIYTYVRYPSANSPAVEIINTRVTSQVQNLRVMVGYLPEQPNILQVLSVVPDQRLDNATSLAFIPPHGDTHTWGGSDPTYIAWRQITDFRLYAQGTLQVIMQGGIATIAGVVNTISTQPIDLSNSIPSSAGARWSLISLDSTGAVIVTDGSIQTNAAALNNTHIPATPSGNWRIWAIKLQYGQTTIDETRLITDTLDLRWPQNTGTGSIAVSDIALTTNHIIVGNASNVGADVAMSGDATIVASGALTLATVNANVGTFGSATQVPVLTVNAKGLITAVSNTTIAGVSPVGAALTRGSIWRGSAANLAEAYALGTANKVLQSDGTDVVWSTNTLTLTTSLTNQGAAGVLNWGGAYTLGINNSLTLAGYDNSSTLTIGGDVTYSRAARIYALGDSTTSTTYTARLESDLAFPWHVINLGVTGEATPELITRITEVSTAPDAQYAIVLEGINDVVRDYSAATIEANLASIYTTLGAGTTKVVACTIMPFKSSVNWTAGRQTVLDAVNAWILANATLFGADYVVDTYTAVEDPGTADTLLFAYDSGDHLHLSTAGYNKIADTIYVGVSWTATLVQCGVRISATVDLNQSLTTTDTPTFRSLTINESLVFTGQGAGTLLKTGSGSLTLSASGGYTLTIPATGTVALLATANVFTLNQTITKDVPALLLYTTSANANARNWSVQSNYSAYGDFSIVQSNALGGNPQTAGIPRFYVSYQGSAGFGTTNTVIGDGTYFASLTANSTGAIGTGSFYYLRSDVAENRSGLWIKSGTTTAGWLSGVMVGGGFKIGYGNGASETASLTNAILISTSGFELSTAGIWTQMLNDATTSAVGYHLIEHRTSGTSANGFGVGLKFQLQSTTTYAQDAAAIATLWNVATHASAASDLVLSAAYNSGAAIVLSEFVRGRGGATPLTGIGGVTNPAAILHVGASVAGAASLRIPAGTSPSSPVEGDKWNDSTQKADIAFLAGIKQARVGCIYSSYSTVTVSNTTTETTLLGGSAIGTLTVPANFWTVGKTIKITAFGLHTTPGGSPTIQCRLKLGSVTIGDTGALVDKNDTNTEHDFMALITCRTTGATGTVYCEGRFLHHESSTGCDMFPFENTATSTIDTTAAMTIDLTVQFSTNTGISFSLTNVVIEVLN